MGEQGGAGLIEILILVCLLPSSVSSSTCAIGIQLDSDGGGGGGGCKESAGHIGFPQKTYEKAPSSNNYFQECECPRGKS